MIISFAWTTPALLAGAKTMTRRKWNVTHTRKFHAGDIVDAWDRAPRTGKGRKVATIRITRDPYPGWTNELTAGDYEREGFNWLNEHGERDTVSRVMRHWGDIPERIWVVEFELVERVSSASPAAPPASGEGPNLDNGIRHGT